MHILRMRSLQANLHQMGSKVNDEEFTNILVLSLVVSFPRTRYLYTSMVVVVIVSGRSLIYIRR